MQAAIRAADAAALVRAALSDAALISALRRAAAVDVIAVGKAAEPMLAGFASRCPMAIRRAMASCPPPRAPLAAATQWFHGAHPLPDECSLDAARAALALARSAAERDVLVVLLSGGASSMMALPDGGVHLSDKRQTIRTLLDEGANIHELNTVRKQLSAVKGGRLAAATTATVITLLLSDVLDDDPSVIGSGPTVPDSTTASDALAVLARHGGVAHYPDAIVEQLQRAAASRERSTASNGVVRTSSIVRVVGGSATALSGARVAAERLGYRTRAIDQRVCGEARRAALRYLEQAMTLAAALPRPACVLAAGETTVRVSGRGKGGRNQEFALALAEAVAAWGVPAAAASVGTDGIDGPTDAAGAMVDSTTAARASAVGLSVQRHLDDHDAYAFFAPLGDLIRFGPTSTNVADIQALVLG